MDGPRVTLSPARGGPMARNSSAVKIPAGRMVLDGGVVRPLLDRGLLALNRDSLMDELILTWAAADGGEEQRVVLPRGNVKVSWVEKCRSGKVMLFDVDNGRQLHFFWMQSRSVELADTMMKRLQSILERHRRHPVTTRKPQAIQMPTLQRILREVRETAVAQDIDLDTLLATPKLIEALRDDPEFYASRLTEYLPPSQTKATGSPVDLAALVVDSQVQWAAVILSTMLRSETTNAYLSSLFLEDAAPWNASVMAFIMQLIQASSE